MTVASPVVILHVFPSFAMGGQQVRFAALAAALGAGFRHHMTALDGDLSARDALAAECRVEFHKLAAKKSALVSPSNIRAMLALIKTVRPDILCTYNWGSIEAALAGRLFSSLAHLHFEDGFGPDETPARQHLRRVIMRRFVLARSVVVTPSRRLEEVAISRWRLPRGNVRRIANGIDVARFASPAAARTGAVAVGTVGALRPEKNLARLVRVFAGADQHERARLTIIGAGPERAAIAAAAEASGARARIFLPGPSLAPHTVYPGFDIFALSSDTEQAPISLMEAMAAGLPVAATDVGDIAQMVAPENRRFIVPVNEEKAFAAALRTLIDEPALRARLGAANAEKAKAEFGLAPMVEAHRALYLEAAGRGP